MMIFIPASRLKNEAYMHSAPVFFVISYKKGICYPLKSENVIGVLFLCLVSHLHLRPLLQLACFPLKKEIVNGVLRFWFQIICNQVSS